MTENETAEANFYATAIINVTLIVTVGVVAIAITPWAFLGLLFLMSSKSPSTVTVTKEDGTTVEVSAYSLDRDEITQAVEAAQ